VCLGLVAIGVVCLKIDTSGELIGSTGWLMGFFATGMCCYRLRGTRFFDPRWRWVALAGLVASVPLRVFVPAFPLFGSYLLISLAVDRRIPSVKAARFGDLSYGLYIYGWPIEQCVVYASGDTAKWWQVFLIATAISALAAFLSWHLVEKRCRWRSAPAPAAALAPARV
jgi:peptidoglycan/LPS O-acetylase OafA/YrhL